MFEFDYNSDFKDYSLPWAGHRYFARDLVETLQPEIIVELGTWRGTSMFSMLQGIKNKNLNSIFNAIDTWEGDKHAGLYKEGEKYLSDIKILIEKHYSNCKVNLIRKRFENAVNDFDDNSIHLLHIDGLHTYEAVKKDYETWRPKVNKNGVILFHDTMEHRNDFGVWQLWQELSSEKNNFCQLFDHSHGLGILTQSPLIHDQIKELIIRNKDIYINKLYEELKQNHRNLELEINSIYESKWWKLKESIKKVISK
jgi:hypothetical protein